MQYYSLLSLLASSILAQSITVTSPADSPKWDVQAEPLKVTWAKDNVSSVFKWASIQLFNTDDRGITWTFQYVDSSQDTNTFYIPRSMWPNKKNYALNVTAFSDSLADGTITGTSSNFEIVNGLDFDNFSECNKDWSFTNVNSSSSFKVDRTWDVDWKAPGKITPGNLIDLSVRSADDSNFSFTVLDKSAPGYSGSVSIYPEGLQAGKKYYLEGIFHYNRRIAGATPICKLKSETFEIQSDSAYQTN